MPFTLSTCTNQLIANAETFLDGSCHTSVPSFVEPAQFSFAVSSSARLQLRRQLVTCLRQRGPRRVRLLASLNQRLIERERECAPCKDPSIRKAFEKIDTEGKGHITEADLRQYAESHGLPASYVRPFMSAVREHDGYSDGEDSAPEETEVTFCAFSSFVKSREAGLRQAFDLFDLNRDGMISVEDLDLSLGHVSICCPRSRCVYRTRQDVVNGLISRLDMEGNRSSVSFSEFRNFFMLLPQRELLVEYWLSNRGAGVCADLGTRVTVQEQHRRGSAWGHLLAGAVAGATSRTVTAPLETLRLAAMAGTLPSGTSLLGAAQQLVAESGVGALYRGNLVNVVRCAPQKAMDFYTFDLFKSWLGAGEQHHQQNQQQQQREDGRNRNNILQQQQQEGDGSGTGHLQRWRHQQQQQDGRGSPTYHHHHQQQHQQQQQQLNNTVKTFLAAGCAGVCSWLLLYPLEVVRSRLTVDRVGQYQGVLHCFAAVMAAEGPRAFTRGLVPSLAAIFPEAAITYGLHDQLKHTYRRINHKDPGILPSLSFGVVSSWCGQLVSYPLETISRRMQLPVAGPAPALAGPAAAAAVAGTPAGATAAGSSAVAAAVAGGTLGPVAVLQQLLAEGGPGALYRGLGAATLRLVPMAIVSFGMYEVMRQHILRAETVLDTMQAREQCRKVRAAMQHHEQQQQKRLEQEQQQQQRQVSLADPEHGWRKGMVGSVGWVDDGGSSSSGFSSSVEGGRECTSTMGVSSLHDTSSSSSSRVAAREDGEEDCGCAVSSTGAGFPSSSNVHPHRVPPPPAAAAAGERGELVDAAEALHSGTSLVAPQRQQQPQLPIQPLLLVGVPAAAATAGAGAIASKMGGRH